MENRNFRTAFCSFILTIVEMEKEDTLIVSWALFLIALGFNEPFLYGVVQTHAKFTAECLPRWIGCVPPRVQVQLFLFFARLATPACAGNSPGSGWLPWPSKKHGYGAA